MNLQFNDMRELTEFLTWADAFNLQGAINPFEAVKTAAAAIGDNETCDEAPDEQGDGGRDDLPAPIPGGDQHDVPAPVEQKRKRRTKAEMEAARAAEQAGAPAVTEAGKPETTPARTPATVAPENTGNPFARAELPSDPKSPPAAPALPTGDLKEFLTARVAERPELSQVEHLQIARAFIGKHGIARYNESFALAGLSANVMTFSTADCATHAAVLDYLGSE